MAKLAKVLGRLVPRGGEDDEQETSGSSGNTGTAGRPTSHPLWPRPNTSSQPPLRPTTTSKPVAPMQRLGRKVMPGSQPASTQRPGPSQNFQSQPVFQRPPLLENNPLIQNHPLISGNPLGVASTPPPSTTPAKTPETTAEPAVQPSDWGQLKARELTPSEWAQLSPDQQAAVLFNTQAMQAYEADIAAGEDVYTSRLALQEALGAPPSIEDEFRNRIRILAGNTDTPTSVNYSDLPIVKYDELFDAQGHVRTTDPDEIIAIARTDRQRLVNSLAAQVEQYIVETRVSTNEIRFDNPTAQADYEGTLQQMLDPAVLSSYNWPEAQMFLRQSGYDPEDFRSYVQDRISMYSPAEGQTTREQLLDWFGQE